MNFGTLCMALLAVALWGSVLWVACSDGEPCDNGLGRETGMWCR